MTYKVTLFLVSVLALWVNCSTLKPELRDHQGEQLATQGAQLQQLQEQMRTDREVLYQLLAEMMCPNPKVRAFFQSCPTIGENTCSTQDVAGVLGEMASVDHTMFYLYFGQDADTMVDERRALLKNLVRRHIRRPTTRLLVAALPANLSARTATTAMPTVGKTARSLRQMALEFYTAERRETHPKEPPLPVLPATAILCNQTDSVVRAFQQKNSDNRPLSGEPTRGQPQVIAWAFLVDC